MTRTIAVWIVVALFAVCGIAAQQAKPKFEVAAIKRNVMTDEQFFRPGAGGVTPEVGMSAAGGRFNASRVTVRSLIIRAFGIEGRNVVGGPAWLNSDRFDINAVANPKTTVPEMNVMLQALLAERFALRTRIEKRPADVQVLTMARSDGRLGSGLRRTTAECEAKMGQGNPSPRTPASVQESIKAQIRADVARKGAAPATPPACGTLLVQMLNPEAGALLLVGTGKTLSGLAEHISTELKAPVVDRTGLTGWFDISMEYSKVLSASPTATNVGGLDFRSALERHLGLRLARQKVPVDMLVIDSVSQPTAN
jgi:uncharacterized protein (TIGR03435 family)